MKHTFAGGHVLAFGLGSFLCAALPTSLEAQSLYWRVEGQLGGDTDYLGRALDRAGDVNGDGIEDLAFARTFAYGVLDGLSGEVLHEIDVIYIVSSVSGAGDVDQDGYADFVRGLPFDGWQGSTKGTARVVSGKTGLGLFTTGGLHDQDQFGTDVNDAGDINGDGIPDIVVGATSDEAGIGASGTVVVCSGVDGSRLWTLPAFALAAFGTHVAGVGDQDLDGVPDVLGGPLWDPLHGLVFSGRTGEQLLDLVSPDGDVISVQDYSCLGDLNGDGIPEIGLGSAGASTESLQYVGSLDVMLGGTDTVLYRVFGKLAGQQFGHRISGGRDLNGDGWPDIAVTSYSCAQAQGCNLYPGRVTILSGVDGSEICEIQDDNQANEFGMSVAVLGDVNGDGLGEIAVGAPGVQVGTELKSGRIDVYSASTLALSTDKTTLKLGVGGYQQLRLKAGVQHGGELFVLLGTSTGIVPGLDALGLHLPLNFDAYTSFALTPGASTLSTIAGVLGPDGKANATFGLPPGLPAAWNGLTLQHAYVLFDPLLGNPTLTSNSVPITLIVN